MGPRFIIGFFKAAVVSETSYSTSYPLRDHISWTDYYSSGETATASHEWTWKGLFEIKVKSKDIYGYESEWSDPLSVSMPMNQQATYSLFLQFLEHFPRMFPIIRQLLGL